MATPTVDVPPSMPTPGAADEKTLGAVAYLLTLITGLIIYLIADEEQRYARWHALQAIGLGVVGLGIGIAVNVVFALIAMAPGGFVVGWLFFLLSPLLGLAGLVLVVVLALKAYNDDSLRLPLLAGFADKHA